MPDYVAACALIEEFAHARGISVTVEINPSLISSALRVIVLRHRGFTRTLEADHETLMHEESFRTLLMPQVQAAIRELAASV